MPAEKRKKTPKEKKFHVEVLKQTVALSTAGFGLAAALAWNTLIQEAINTYFKRFFPSGGKVLTMLIYAFIVTILAVAVTYYLSKIASRMGDEEE
jgi:hypothetical protein